MATRKTINDLEICVGDTLICPAGIFTVYHIVSDPARQITRLYDKNHPDHMVEVIGSGHPRVIWVSTDAEND